MSTRVIAVVSVLVVAALCGVAGPIPSAAEGRHASVGSSPGGPAPPLEIFIYAAASLKDVLGEIGPICEGRTGARFVFNFGASNDLARQIVAANKADLFFSADEGWMDQVARADLVDTTSRKDLLSNHLVVVVPVDSRLALRSAADLSGEAVRRLALANPEAVPAGRYAKAWLEKVGAWEKVREKVVPAPDVRAALASVESGAVQAGVVYRTDAAITHRVRVAFIVPSEEEPRITYPVAALRDRPHVDVARKVIDCYAGKEARELFERFGFGVIEAAKARSEAPATSN